MPKRHPQHPPDPTPCNSPHPDTGAPCGLAKGHSGKHIGYGKTWD